MRKLAMLFALLGSLFVVSAAQAAPPTSVFDGTIACTTQGPGATEGQTWCGTGQHNQNANVRSTVESFDGVPIDVCQQICTSSDEGEGGEKRQAAHGGRLWRRGDDVDGRRPGRR